MVKDAYRVKNMWIPLTKGQRNTLRRMRFLRRNIDELMENLISYTAQSDLEGILEIQKILLDTVNKEIRELIVECVGELT